MIDFGIRPRCENCINSYCYYDSKQRPIGADCSKLKLKIRGKDFESFNCMYFERKGNKNDIK